MSEPQEQPNTRRRFMTLLLGSAAVVALPTAPAQASAEESVIDGGAP